MIKQFGLVAEQQVFSDKKQATTTVLVLISSAILEIPEIFTTREQEEYKLIEKPAHINAYSALKCAIY